MAIRDWLTIFSIKKARSPSDKNAFHAVAVVPGARACQAALEATGVRFLSRQAPKLPLSGCDRTQCTCSYRHYPDRRTGPRRSADFFSHQARSNVGEERRKSRGRRSTDRLS